MVIEAQWSGPLPAFRSVLGLHPVRDHDRPNGLKRLRKKAGRR